MWDKDSIVLYAKAIVLRVSFRQQYHTKRIISAQLINAAADYMHINAKYMQNIMQITQYAIAQFDV